MSKEKVMSWTMVLLEVVVILGGLYFINNNGEIEGTIILVVGVIGFFLNVGNLVQST